MCFSVYFLFFLKATALFEIAMYSACLAHCIDSVIRSILAPRSNAGLDWPSLHSFRAPHIPKGSSKMKRMLEELQDTPSDSPRYPDLIRAITANFDEFKESTSHTAFTKGGSRHSSGARHGAHGNNANNSPAGGDGTGAATKQEADAAFLNYTYKRKTVRACNLVALFVYASAPVYISSSG
jgi:hypothetical protein